MTKEFALAQPEKRLFISLLTRDIGLLDAILDLVDNSINSALIQQRHELGSIDDYMRMLSAPHTGAVYKVEIKISEDSFSIEDNCGGISIDSAKDGVFKFGRSTSDTVEHKDDTLSVYGIGLKRAIFKIGNSITMISNHPDGGFKMVLDVDKWGRKKEERWEIPFDTTPADHGRDYGTSIVIKELYPDIKRKIMDGSVAGDIVSRVAQTYSYFLNRAIEIIVNGEKVEAKLANFGENVASETFTEDGVSCYVIAGMYQPQGKFYTAETAGWYVLCNGRAVAFADKSSQTGWGNLLPSFQPKHRPFMGIVFFISDEPERLPWTTTKASINQESALWQHTLRVMARVGRQITTFLDKRFSEDGTEITTDELKEAAGRPVTALLSFKAQTQNFRAAPRKKETTSVQYSVRVKDIEEIKAYLGRRTMSNSELGLHIFDYYLQNVVRE